MMNVNGNGNNAFDLCCNCNCEVNVSESCLNYGCKKCGGLGFGFESTRQTPEALSSSFAGERFDDSDPPSSPPPIPRLPSRSEEDEEEDVFLSPSHDTSDVDTFCDSGRNEFYSFTSSIGSSPTDSPSRIHFTSNRVGLQNTLQAVLEKPAIWETEKINNSSIIDIEANSLIWLPPPMDEADEHAFVAFDDDDDDDDDDEARISGPFFSYNLKDPLVQPHFTSLVAHLLQGQDNCGSSEEWTAIVTTLAWQAASFIRPDTSRGGSMDPCDYVKVKCVASGSPSQSKLIKGVVCTKNIKHKRMTSQYKNTRLLLLAGALECQRDPNHLASFETLLQQEKDSLKSIISKIEAHRPNVVLVEKSASSFAQDLLLEKHISLVLNVKKPLLERIAKCSGAVISPSIDHLSTARLGHCQLFHLEKISEEHEPINQFNKRPSKTLMFFEGCPRRLGCTVILRGSSREELKRVKNVVQYAVFAAYHLSLETSFIRDEGARLPKVGLKSSLSNDVTSLISAGSADLNLEGGLQDSLYELREAGYDEAYSADNFRYRKALSMACDENLALTHPCPRVDDSTSIEYYSPNENNQSILVSFSSHCIVNETVCERSRLLRIKFYSSSDKPLGRYLRDNLFDKASKCRSCKESTEAHAICYTHPLGNLMINVRCLPSTHLSGEDDGKIWMWYRCLRCKVPPETQRVVMSDAAWGLSFGKFLELSFSKHAMGNRIASCGHSLQTDCLRFYGFGSMVACFRYSPITILSVRLPPYMLEFGGPAEQKWARKEASELLSKAEMLYEEISNVLGDINYRSLSSAQEFSDSSELHSHIMELHDILANEKGYYEDLLHVAKEGIQECAVDILEINRLRHSLLISYHDWGRRLYLLDSLLRRSSSPKSQNSTGTSSKFRDLDLSCENNGNELKPEHMVQDKCDQSTSLERLPSAASILSDQIDCAWSGGDTFNPDISEVMPARQPKLKESPAFRRLLLPTRGFSFDSAQNLQERMAKAGPNLLNLRSFHASGDYKYMLRDPVPNVQRTYSEKLNPIDLSTATHSLTTYSSLLPEGARLMVPKDGQCNIVIPVYDDEPTSVISYALCSKEYVEWLTDKPNLYERGSSGSPIIKMNSTASDFSKWQSLSSLDLDHTEDVLGSSSPHLGINFEDNSATASGKVKFSVTCYFGKQFDALRRRCCPNEVDFGRSLSRCRRWSAQGGKSNVYFAKSYDERFIIKQVTKTELESFDEFALEYFKYLADAHTSGSPTCLAKILGIYQVGVRQLKSGKETKMDVMVMENLFFNRNISKVYDLKGSERSRYNADTTGDNKVLLDMNLLETLRTNPIFLESKAKRRLERAIWNDTFFLASMDVMDYSLLVGVDEEEKELVLGIIDYMRQYTWDKHLETWVKASGILGGPKNVSPTIVSPKQYKKRFRKAMTSYFHALPHQWSSSSSSSSSSSLSNSLLLSCER